MIILDLVSEINKNGKRAVQFPVEVYLFIHTLSKTRNIKLLFSCSVEKYRS